MTKNSQILIEKKPFTQDIDRKSFYYFQALKQRLIILNRLFSRSSRLILVIGEAGSGKTLLLKQFLASDETNWRKCRINATDPLNESSNKLIRKMQARKAYINTKNKLPVIMMDDAERLSYEELLFLVKMLGVKGFSRSLKQLIFFCEPRMLKVLSSLDSELPEDGTIEKLYIPLLSRLETEEYIERRVCSTGYTGSTPFTQLDINRIFEASGGIPGEINKYAAGVLEKKLKKQKKLSSFIKKSYKDVVNKIDFWQDF